MRQNAVTTEPRMLEDKTREFATWLRVVDSLSMSPVFCGERIMATLVEADQKNSPVPFILTLCPAVENLPEPTKQGQTRKLIPLAPTLPRFKRFGIELAEFMRFTRQTLSLEPEIFLIFTDKLEPGSENVLVNWQEADKIANESVTGIKELFFTIDQENGEFFRTWGLRIPKVRKQTLIESQPAKSRLRRAEVIKRKEHEILDPQGKLFPLWVKHLNLTREDKDFISTGWQSKESAEMIWARARSRLAEFIADGVILPKLAEVLLAKRFPQGMPRPIFIASSVRPGGIIAEQDGFNAEEPTGVIAPFRNIGRWAGQPSPSPWIERFWKSIIKEEGKDG